MAVKDQWNKLKDNWLLILISVIVIFVVMGGSSGIFSLIDDYSSSSDYGGTSSGYERPSPMSYGGTRSYESASYAEPSASPVPYSEVALKSSPSISSDVSAPPLQDQMVAKTASMETKVERGTFANEESTLKSIVKASDAILLWQNVNTYGEGRAQYQAGRYQIKIDATKYDAIISQLKAIGTVESFTKHMLTSILNLPVRKRGWCDTNRCIKKQPSPKTKFPSAIGYSTRKITLNIWKKPSRT